MCADLSVGCVCLDEGRELHTHPPAVCVDEHGAVNERGALRVRGAVGGAVACGGVGAEAREQGG